MNDWNKSRELLNIAFKDAVAHGYISRNPVPDTKPYRRKKPKIMVLNKERMRFFLAKAGGSNWYLEILLGLFVGLRKGEILGLKISDFDMENSTVSIKRQVTANPIVMKGQFAVSEYRVIEKEPKTQNGFRTLRVPKAVMEEVVKREKLIALRKETMGEAYIDYGYLSCRENGLPHPPASFNTALTKLCSRNGLPHITVHGLRHMYATRSTYCTLLLKNDFNPKAVSRLMGHAKEIITMDVYGDNANIIPEEIPELLEYMDDVMPKKQDADNAETKVLDTVINAGEYLDSVHRMQ